VTDGASSTVDLSGDQGRRVRGESFQIVVRELRSAILGGELRPGERIPEAAVAERFGTSRLPVRDALRELQRQGLVTLESKRGARVLALGQEELAEIFLLRERLEPALVAAAATRLPEAALEELKEIATEMEAIAEGADTKAWMELDRRFHMTTYSHASLPRVLRLVESYWDIATQYYSARRSPAHPVSFALSHLEHRLLLAALADRRASDAEQIVRLHIRRTFRSIAADASTVE
jgi:DNA-binding GntR family transcriptional regulator